MLEREVNKAADTILKGGTLLYPTDTIWGLGCDATNEKAVQEIFRIKQRPDRKSMLVLVSDKTMLAQYLEKLPDAALELILNAEKPITIIYPGARNLAPGLIAEDGSIGIRLCLDPFCQMLLEHCKVPLVSTSANLSGDPAPANFQAINPLLKNEVDFVVAWRQDEDGGAAASSIIKLEKDGSLTVIR